MKINKDVKSFFDTHPTVDEFYFASNGSAFFKEADATTTADNLKKAGGDGSVTKITRADVEAWVAAGSKEDDAADVAIVELSPLEQAIKADQDAKNAVTLKKAELESANAYVKVATDAKAALPADATPKQKSDATKAVNNANKAAANVQADYDNAVVDADTAAKALAAIQPEAK